MNLDNIAFEVDSKTTLEVIYSSREDISVVDNIIMVFWVMLSSKFFYSRVKFIRKQTYMVALTLIGDVSFLVSPTIYFYIPNCIETLIINEML